MATFHLRDATLRDAPAIAAIYAPYVETSCFTFEETAPGADDIAARIAKTLGAGLPYLVAETEDGVVIGYAYAGPFHARSAYRHTVENSVYVAAGHVRGGIGRALMQRLIAECTARGCRQMIALIADRDDGPSARLHTALGFRPAGKLASVGLKFGRWVDVLQMQLALGDGDRSLPRA
jgi:phosphinothricin acetyltransferase